MHVMFSSIQHVCVVSKITDLKSEELLLKRVAMVLKKQRVYSVVVENHPQ